MKPYKLTSWHGSVTACWCVVAAVMIVAAPLSLPAALIAYWNFDEGSGTLAQDRSGVASPHDGTLGASAGATPPQWIGGRFGTALDFNRLNDNAGSLVTVPFQADLRLNDAFTISFWYRPGPNIGSFPGPMRIGSQSATSGSNIGWGFFRARSGNRVTYKRGNAQPNMFPPTLVNGTWYHVVLRHDGGNQNIAIIFGMSTNSTTQSWLDATTTAVFEMGRMDQFDDCDLDDVALFDEALPLERIYTLNSVPTQLGLDYSLAEVRALWAIFDGGPGSVGTVKGRRWAYTTDIPGTPAPGEAFISGNRFYVVLGPGAGLTAPATYYGDISPAGVGMPGTLTFGDTPDIAPSARFVFDLGADAALGPHNDFIEIQGDLNVASNTVVINPLAALVAEPYWLMKYTGAMNGRLNPNVVHNTRYDISLDEGEGGKIKLTVKGTNAWLQWASDAMGTWDLTRTTWSNLVTQTADVFRQADRVRFDDARPVLSDIVIGERLFPAAMVVASSTSNFTFTGTGSLGGMSEGLTKSGTATLTLGTANNFLGPVVVEEGMVKIANPAALGSTVGGTIVRSGATLDLGGYSPGAEPIAVSGAGINGMGAIINSGGALINNGLLGVVSLQGDTTLGGTNRFDLFGGSLVGNGYRLVKVGPAEIALAHLGETGLGEIEVLGGQLTVLGNTRLGNPTERVRVGAGATLAFWAVGPNQLNKRIQVDNGRLLNATAPAADTALLTGPVRLRGTNTVEGGSSIAMWGELGGDGRLNKNGAGTLALMSSVVYQGTFNINAGRLVLGTNVTLGGVSNLILASGAILDVSSARDPQEYEVPAGQTLMGQGQVHGSVVAVERAVVAPGMSAGTLIITNHLTLRDGATVVFELGDSPVEGGGTNDLLQVLGDLTVSGPVTIRIVPMAPLNTTEFYTLINYSGRLRGSLAEVVVVSDSRYSFYLDTSVAGKIRVLATAEGAILTWRGDHPMAPGVWDLNKTPNWAGGERFLAGDTVVFDNSGVVTTVELVGDLYPALWRVEEDFREYVFRGEGRVRGGGLTKSQAGRMVIANTGVNDFPGAITLLGGTLQVGNGGTFGNLGPGPVENQARLILDRSDDVTWGNVMTGRGQFIKVGTNTLTLGASMAGFDGTVDVQGGRLRPTAAGALGTAVGTTYIRAGAALEINGINFGAEPLIVEGVGPDGRGVLVNSGGAQNNALQFLTLAGDATVNAIGRFDVRANPDAAVMGNGYALTKLGPNQFSLVQVGDAALGNILVWEGTFSVEGNTYLGSNGVMVVTNGATVMFWGSSVAQDKAYALGNGARLLKDNGTATLRGRGFLSGGNSVEVASNAGTDFTLAGPISGEGSLTKLGAGNLFLTGSNTYTGGTVVSAGNLFLGNGTEVGSVAGEMVVNASLYFWRSDVFTLTNTLRGAGGVYVRTPGAGGAMILDGSAQMEIGGSLEVGRDYYGKLIIRDGARPVVGRINVGNIAGTAGDVVQQGGEVIVSLEMRVGHWPDNTSTYVLGGGTLSLTNVPAGVVNQNAVAEQNGILYIGIDGTGVFTQTGGAAMAHGMVLDGRWETAGTDTFNLEGGVFRLGASGLKSGNLDNNTSYQINLGGGTLGAWQSWTSVLAMTLTGTNGDVTVDTDTHTVQLTGLLSGPGGLNKRGAGVLELRGNHTYGGLTRVYAGTLRVQGSLAGTLRVREGAALELGPGWVTCSIGQDARLSGLLVMKIAKSGSVLASDRLVMGGDLICGGTLRVVASGDALADGDTFDLFDAARILYTFNELELPALPGGLRWDVSNLLVDGTIRVTRAPPAGPVFAAPVRDHDNLVLRATGGQPGWSYEILASERITQPVAEWVVVASGRIGGDGTITETVPIHFLVRQYYFLIRMMSGGE
ncbi:MAG: autotransporter-associated beta strand repeat-containing protein [Verrucomicrobiae bacterium]|nr:autotransporter-associated beta strand repeat-containing protein [Verrucomicrobiae bacterium]